MSYSDVNKNRVRYYDSLGMRRYLSLMKYVKAVVGNSSSGIIEAPSFGIPTLNIGDRQKGRVMSESIFNCADNESEILGGLLKVLSTDCQRQASHSVNLYYKPDTAKNIFDVIAYSDLNQRKSFYNLPL